MGFFCYIKNKNMRKRIANKIGEIFRNTKDTSTDTTTYEKFSIENNIGTQILGILLEMGFSPQSVFVSDIRLNSIRIDIEHCPYYFKTNKRGDIILSHISVVNFKTGGNKIVILNKNFGKLNSKKFIANLEHELI